MANWQPSAWHAKRNTCFPLPTVFFRKTANATAAKVKSPNDASNLEFPISRHYLNFPSTPIWNIRTVSTTKAKFAVGQLIQHRLFDYRGVVIDVDPHFRGTDDWYLRAARSRPPKDRPWYHVLVDGGQIRTYVAERNMEPDTTGGPIDHPDVQIHFQRLTEGRYIPLRKGN
jgi:heat shock protein HspQ